MTDTIRDFIARTKNNDFFFIGADTNASSGTRKLRGGTDGELEYWVGPFGNSWINPRGDMLLELLRDSNLKESNSFSNTS
jgi:hypothetical protein